MLPELLLNGESATQDALAPWVDALNSPSHLTRWGGLIWKFLLDPGRNPSREWALSPALWEGERLNHFDLPFTSPDPRCLIGSVSSRGEWMILVKLPRKAWDEQTREFVRRQWRELEFLLTAAGFRGEAPLDIPTRLFLEEAGVFSPAPGELCPRERA